MAPNIAEATTRIKIEDSGRDGKRKGHDFSANTAII